MPDPEFTVSEIKGLVGKYNNRHTRAHTYTNLSTNSMFVHVAFRVVKHKQKHMCIEKEAGFITH